MYTVLFADDTLEIRELFCGVLREAGYCVLEAEDGAEALSLARSHAGAIDLLITDVSMPRMSGISLRRAFADSYPATPVLFISGNPGTSIVGECFLAKPFTAGDLISTVKELLATRRFAAAAGRQIRKAC